MPPHDQMLLAALLDWTMSQCEGFGGVLVTNIIRRPCCSLNGNCFANTSWVLPPGRKRSDLVPLKALAPSTVTAFPLTVKSPLPAGAPPAVCISKSLQNLPTKP